MAIVPKKRVTYRGWEKKVGGIDTAQTTANTAVTNAATADAKAVTADGKAVAAQTDATEAKTKKANVSLTSGSPSHTITADINFVVIGATADGTVTLPAPDNVNHKRVIIKNKEDSSHNITVGTPSGSIEGSSTIVLTPGDAVELITDETNWHII